MKFGICMTPFEEKKENFVKTFISYLRCLMPKLAVFGLGLNVMVMVTCGVFFFNSNTVTVVASGQGPTIGYAVFDALRLAAESNGVKLSFDTTGKDFCITEDKVEVHAYAYVVRMKLLKKTFFPVEKMWVVDVKATLIVENKKVKSVVDLRSMTDE